MPTGFPGNYYVGSGTQVTAGTLYPNNYWPQWVAGTYVTGTAGTTVWPTWLEGTGANQPQQLYTQPIWYGWQPNGGFVQAPNGVAPPPPRELTEDERRKIKRDSLILRNRMRARELRRKRAEHRARELLLSHLSERQREEYEQSRAFHVETAGGRRVYRIAYGLAGNIRLVKCEGEPPRSRSGRPLREGTRFCAHVYPPDGPVPHEDNVLAQKLLLESAEDQFLAMANVS